MAQELKREQPVRLPNPSAQPFVTALKTARFYAVLFFWVSMACVLAYAVTFVLTEWIGLYDLPPVKAPAATESAEPKPAATPAPAKEPAPGATSWLGLFEGTAEAASRPDRLPGELFPNVPPEGRAPSKGTPKEPVKEPTPPTAQEAPKEPAAGEGAAATEGKIVGEPEQRPKEEVPLTPEQKRQRAQYHRHVTVNILRPARTVCVLSSLLLGATLFLYLQIALLGRLAGIRQLTNAVFLLLLFLAAIFPWDSIFEGAHMNISALFDFGQLLEAHAARLRGATGDFWAQAQYFARFFGMPVVSIGLLAWSGIQFAAGYSDSVLANE